MKSVNAATMASVANAESASGATLASTIHAAAKTKRETVSAFGVRAISPRYRSRGVVECFKIGDRCRRYELSKSLATAPHASTG